MLSEAETYLGQAFVEAGRLPERFLDSAALRSE